MLRNYFRVALRTLRKHKAYSLINIIGLAIGMTCCALILLYVQDELSYDRFHEHADRIVRLRVERYAGGGEEELTATASAPMTPAALNDFPQIEHAVRFEQRTYLVEQEDRRFYEERFFWADSSVFAVFSFPLVQGDPVTALAAPFSVVLTEAMADKYFGDADPMGQSLVIEDRALTVTGVVENVPSQSHVTFDFLGSFTTLEALNESPSSSWNWWSLSYHTYFLLTEGASQEALGEQIRELPSRYIGDQESDSGYRQFLYLQPLTDIHLHSHYRYELAPNSRAAYVYVFSAIALFILAIACINFMNLSTARSTQRAKEVGVRKVSGAGRRQLIGQFLGESVGLSLIALAAALILIQLLLPLFNTLAYKDLSLNYFRHAPFVLGMIGFAVLVGLAAGSYPAFVLSAFRPLHVLKGAVRSGRGGVLLRKGLVVFQFALSILLIVGTAVAFKQLSYMQTANLGFEKEQTLVLNVRNNEALAERFEAFKQELGQLPAVRSAAFSSSVPGRDNNTNVISPQRGMTEDGQTMSILAVDYDFVDAYGLEVLHGRGFSRQMVSDDSVAFLINEATMRALGWQDPAEALDTELTRQFGDSRRVVGVVRDFHFKSLQSTVEPIVFMIYPSWYRYASVRIATEDVPETLVQIQGVWDAFSPGRPFDYFFLDDDYDRQYRAEERISGILNVFTVLAIFIACLGLFALASFTAEQRTKEIGIRKVLGASVTGITVMLSGAFTKLVLLATLIACPVAYVLLERWLQDFAFRTEIGLETFLLAGLAALVIAWLTVGYQSVKAALADPVEALRYE